MLSSDRIGESNVRGPGLLASRSYAFRYAFGRPKSRLKSRRGACGGVDAAHHFLPAFLASVLTRHDDNKKPHARASAAINRAIPMLQSASYLIELGILRLQR